MKKKTNQTGECSETSEKCSVSSQQRTMLHNIRIVSPGESLYSPVCISECISRRMQNGSRFTFVGFMSSVHKHQKPFDTKEFASARHGYVYFVFIFLLLSTMDQQTPESAKVKFKPRRTFRTHLDKMPNCTHYGLLSDNMPI